MADVLLVEGARTPRGELLGSLAEFSAVELGGRVVESAVDRADVDPRTVDWVAMGNAVGAGTGPAPTRQMALEAGLPTDAETTTVTEAAGSSLRTAALAVDRLESGRGGLVAVGGTESVSNAPYLARGVRAGLRRGDAALVDAVAHDALRDPTADAHLGELAEATAEREGIDRDRQDRYAVESHDRATDAIDAGAFVDEIVPVGGLDVDETPSRTARHRAFSHRDPAFVPDGRITPANAAGPADGAACTLMTTRAAADAAGIEPIAELADYAVAYDDPGTVLTSAVDAVENLLARNDLQPSDVDHYELDETFAAQTAYAVDRLGVDHGRINPLGGGVAFGLPVGATGAMGLVTLAHALADADESAGYVGQGPSVRGVAAVDVAGGGGIAVLLQR